MSELEPSRSSSPQETWGRTSFLLGAVRVDPRLGVVEHDGRIARLEPRALQLLLLLAARPGEVISKGEVMRSAWEVASLSDDAVWRAIAKLRQAFGDDAAAPWLIDTVPGRGYRLLVAPRPLPASDAPAPVAVGGRNGARRRRGWAVGALLTALVVGWLLRPPRPTAAGATPVRTAGASHAGPLTQGRWYLDGLTAESGARATPLFAQAVEQAPDDPTARAYLGMALLQAGRVDAARREVDLAAALGPGAPEVLLAQGLLAHADGHLSAADRHLRTAAASDPSLSHASVALAEIALERGDLGRALHWSRRAVAAPPAPRDAAWRARALGVAATVAGWLGDGAGALTCAGAARRHDPFEPRALAVVAQGRLARDDREGARWLLADAVAAIPASLELRTVATGWELRHGDRRRALTLAGPLLAGRAEPAALATTPLLATHLAPLVVDAGSGSSGWLDEAAGAASAAVREGSERWQDLLVLAATRALRGDRSGGIATLRQAIERGLSDRELLRREPALAALRGEPAYSDLEGLVERRLAAARRELGVPDGQLLVAGELDGLCR